MVHPLVEQLRFARSEFRRGIEGVTPEDAQRRLMPMNCISSNIGHLAWQEQRYWLTRAQAKTLIPDLNEQFAFGAAACTPDLDEAWSAWNVITAAVDPWLDSVTTETLIYHYWYHTGENAAIRQQLGHTGLPDFVGDIDNEAPYRPERTMTKTG